MCLLTRDRLILLFLFQNEEDTTLIPQTNGTGEYQFKPAAQQGIPPGGFNFS